MPAYSFVPKCSSVENIYTEGEIVVSRTYIGDYRIGYWGQSTAQIRYNLEWNEEHGDFLVQIITNDISEYFRVYLVGPTGTIIYSRLYNNLMYNNVFNGWCGSLTLGFEYNSGEMTTSTDIYSTAYECSQAMKFDEVPSGASGVVVTALASPLDVPVSTDGVIVTAIARLLDPNDQGGTSNPGGGQGTYDDTSDVIPLPTLPTISAADSGLLTLFRPDLTQLKALGSYLWTNILDFIENLQKLFSNPMDYFVAFHIVPCNPDVGDSRTIKLGLWNTNISMPPVLSQWYEHNCGTVSLPEYWGSALDYAPNTKVNLFLPFIGAVSLNTDEVMGKQINVTYRIDLLSGQCVAIVSTPTKVGQAPSAIYQFTGECSVSIPLTGADWSRIYSAAIGTTTAVVAGVAGVAGASSTGAQNAFATAQNAKAVNNAGMAFSRLNATSKGIKGVNAMREAIIESAQASANAAQSVASSGTVRSAALQATVISHTVNNVAGNIMGAKPNIQHTGNITGSAGLLGVLTPYLFVEFPNQSLAKDYKHYVGYPSNMYANLGNCSGYTECEQVIVSGINATDSEIAEITEALKQGVYL